MFCLNRVLDDNLPDVDERYFALLNHLSRLKKNGESERFVKVPWKYFPNLRYTMGRRKHQFNNIWEEFYDPIMNNDQIDHDGEIPTR